MIYYNYIYRDPSRNNEPIYVGKGKCNRIYSHLKSKKIDPFINRLRFMKKNGIEPIIEFVEDISEEDALWNEQYLIMWYGRKDLGKEPLLNLTNGGEGIAGLKFSEKHRKRLSEASLGKPKSEEHKQHVREARAFQVISDETCRKISESHKGEKNHFYGKKHTEESKKRMSDIRKEYFRKKKENLD